MSVWDTLELQMNQNIYNTVLAEELANGKTQKEAEEAADARLIALAQLDWDTFEIEKD